MTPLHPPKPLSDENPQPPVGFITRKRHEAILLKVRAEKQSALEARVKELEGALESIAANTCCDTCREAALVARAALKGTPR